MIKLVILIHGFGATGDDIMSIANDLKASLPDAKFIAPNAPFKTPEGGFYWFDITEIDEKHFMSGLYLIEPIFLSFLNETLKEHKCKPEEILLIGFSQGASIALHIGLTYQFTLGGVISISGGIVNYDQALNTDLKSKPSVLLIHGKEDKVLPAVFSMRTKRILDRLEVPVQLELIDGLDHYIDERVIKIIENFTQKLI